MILERARAKLNLALHVRARRADGYHEIETLFAFVELGDAVRVRGAGESRFAVTGPFAHALAGEGDNLVTRAAALFAAEFGGGPWEIVLEKNLPVASGIGGGSADAAATLRALGRIRGVTAEALVGCAEALGSDVPACLLGRTALGRGRGELLDPLPAMPETPVLLVNPGVAVSTAEVFRRWDGIDRGPIGAGPPLDMARAGRNDLEAPARAGVPVIGEVLALLTAQPGVLLARMSGSGATCFALFADIGARERAAAACRAQRPEWWCAETRLA